MQDEHYAGADFVITNPPWPSHGKQGRPTTEMALAFADYLPTWFLLSADFKHNKYFKKSGLWERCEKILSVGRVRWIAGSKNDGKDNCAWYLFKPHPCRPVFFARD